MRRSARRIVALRGVLGVGTLGGCGSPSPPDPPAAGSSSSGASGSGPVDGSSSSVPSAADTTEADTTGAPLVCECAPGTDVIHVLGDDGELWAFDPVADTFSTLGPIACGDFRPFSMAVDREGFAWVLLLDNIPHAAIAKGIFRVDLADPGACTPVPYEDGLFGVFGMSFVSNPPPDACETLYVFSYGGTGPFAEGPGLGQLGALDPETQVLDVVGAVDFDGGELAGTGDGRLVALTGVEPLKLVAYDRQDASELARIELPGIARTSASALAFFGGSFYVFTEAEAPGCLGCLERQCSAELAACQADPDCVPVLECLLASGGEGPGCQGDLEGPAGPVRDCIFGGCSMPCDPSLVVSQVRRVEWDAEGRAFTLTERDALAPARVVGAGSSTCVPVQVP